MRPVRFRAIKRAQIHMREWSSIPVSALAWVPSASANPPTTSICHKLHRRTPLQAFPPTRAPIAIGRINHHRPHQGPIDRRLRDHRQHPAVQRPGKYPLSAVLIPSRCTRYHAGSLSTRSLGIGDTDVARGTTAPPKLTTTRRRVQCVARDDRDERIAVGDSPQDLLPPILAAAKLLSDPGVVAHHAQVLNQLVDVALGLARLGDEQFPQRSPLGWVCPLSMRGIWHLRGRNRMGCGCWSAASRCSCGRHMSFQLGLPAPLGCLDRQQPTAQQADATPDRDAEPVSI